MNKLIYPALSLITAVGLYFFYIDPAWTNVQSLVAEEAEFDRSLSDAEEITGLMSRLESGYAGIPRDDLIRLEKFLPRDIDVTHTIHNLNGIAESHGAVVNSINSRDISPVDGSVDPARTKIIEHSFQFTIRTSYEAFKRIMADIEKNLQLANVRSLEIATNVADVERELTGLTEFNIDLVMYSYSE